MLRLLSLAPVRKCERDWECGVAGNPHIGGGALAVGIVMEALVALALLTSQEIGRKQPYCFRRGKEFF
jgi:hypothetical protein